MTIHHVGYLVKNIDKATADFIALGYTEETSAVYDPIRDANISFLVNDGYRVELVSPVSEKSVVYDLLKKYKNMPYHICYMCNNLETAVEEMRGRGFLQMGECEAAPAIGGRRVVFMMSAFGGMIELLEDAK